MRQSGGMRPTFEQRFLVEFRGVRIVWERFLAVVPILNGGNVYFDNNIVSMGMTILRICKVWDAILTKYGRLCLSNVFWVELMVVRFNWEHILVIVPIINDGNIYETENVNFWDTFLQCFSQNIWNKKGSDPIDPVAMKYYELEDETTCVEEPTVAALQCIKNQLPTRSGSICMDQSLQDILKQIPGPRKVLKT